MTPLSKLTLASGLDAKELNKTYAKAALLLAGVALGAGVAAEAIAATAASELPVIVFDLAPAAL
ncbi:MAG: hypothetical protein ABI867_41330 [Kofleriaceae bacterium]